MKKCRLAILGLILFLIAPSLVLAGGGYAPVPAPLPAPAGPSVLSFANPQSATPLLDSIIANDIGAGIKSVSNSSLLNSMVGMASRTATPILDTIVAMSEGNTPAVIGNLLTIPVYVYCSPAAGMAASLAVGYLTHAELDVNSAYNKGYLQNYPLLADIVNNYFRSNPPAVPAPGYVTPISIDDAGGMAYGLIDHTDISDVERIGFETVHHNPVVLYNQVGSVACYRQSVAYPNGAHDTDGTALGRWFTTYWTIDLNKPYTLADVNAPLTNPATLSPTQLNDLIKKLGDAVLSNPLVKDALKNLAKDHPDLIPDPRPLTINDVHNWSQTNTSNAYNTLNNTLNNLQASDPTNTAIATASAQAKADQAQAESKAADNTYPQLSPSGFDKPYDPGKFDIPKRFKTFMDTIKQLPLFSLSQNFFNSFPGGGSPIYEIEAGQYGHHTIDLSQTLSGGLAVLRGVLLVCFGFLSIRAIVMKR